MNDVSYDLSPSPPRASRERLMEQFKWKETLMESERQALAELRSVQAEWLGEDVHEEAKDKDWNDEATSKVSLLSKSIRGERFKRFTYEQIDQRLKERGELVEGYGFLLMESTIRCDLLGCTFDSAHPSWNALVEKVKGVNSVSCESSHPMGLDMSNRVKKWENVLFQRYKGDEAWKLYLIEKGLVDIDGSLDLFNQRVVHMDCLRTRQDLEMYRTQSMRDEMELVLTLYCKGSRINYKQGLNYVLAPFMHPQLHIKDRSKQLAFFSAFIDLFQPSIFIDDSFGVLQCVFKLFDMLISYHDPQIHRHLSLDMMSPELYAASWFITLLANRLESDVVFHLWDRLLVDHSEHPYMQYFIWLALLIWNRRTILASSDLLPEVLNQIVIESDHQVDCIVKMAHHFCCDTPQSMLTLIETVIQSGDLLIDSPLFSHIMSSRCVSISAAELASDETGQYIVLDCRKLGKEGRFPQRVSIEVDLDRIDDSEYTEHMLKSIGGQRVCIVDHDGSMSNVSVLVAKLLEKYVRFLCFCDGGFRDVHQILFSQNRLHKVLRDHSSLRCKLCHTKAQVDGCFIDFTFSNEVAVFGSQMNHDSWMQRNTEVAVQFKQRLLVKVFTHFLDLIDLKVSKSILLFYTEDSIKSMLDPCVSMFTPVLDIKWNKVEFRREQTPFKDETTKEDRVFFEQVSTINFDRKECTINAVVLSSEIHWRNVSQLSRILMDIANACASDNISIDVLCVLSLVCGRRCGEEICQIYNKNSRKFVLITAVSQHSSYKSTVPGI